jgi:molybdopterin molybdotransferase
VPLGTEKIAIHDADDRVLAAAVIAQRSAPLADVSAMDGIAVRTSDVGATATRLAIVGTSFAGAGYVGSVQPGQCVRIFTGAPLPAGTDQVIMQEGVAFDGLVATASPRNSGKRHVRSAGSDFRYGDILVRDGQRLRPQHLVAAAAGDIDEVEVFRRPKVHVVCCGDELVPAGTAWRWTDRIPDSISGGVAALIRRSGGIVVGRTLLADDLVSMRTAVAHIAPDADAVVVIGGASVGERDFAKAAFAVGMRRVFDKVAIKPGKPVWLGDLGGKPVLGLPGNPTSAMVTARLLLVPLVAGMAGRKPAESLSWRTARLAGTIEGCADRDVFVRARCAPDGLVHPLTSQDSADQRTLSDAELLVRVRPGPSNTAPKETIVEIVDF